MERIASGAWEMLTDSMGNSCRLPANCSYKIFSFRRDHSSFIAPDSLAEFQQWVPDQRCKRGIQGKLEKQFSSHHFGTQSMRPKDGGGWWEFL